MKYVNTKIYQNFKKGLPWIVELWGTFFFFYTSLFHKFSTVSMPYFYNQKKTNPKQFHMYYQIYDI